jgi:uncharacterized membrane protein
MLSKFMLDPLANSIAVLVLLGMLATVIIVAAYYIRGSSPAKPWPAWLIAALSIVGLGVAIYMTYIETTHAEAVCGPVGDCNSVQQSPYATLFGFLPVGILGAIGYATILILWVIRQYGSEKLRNTATILIFALSGFGILFSIYLTFLEPFVIGASCVWCISSAIVMTLIFWTAATLTLPLLQAD